MEDLFPGYVIDTSAFIDLWRRRYPRDVFPTIWQRIDELINSGELIAPDEVLGELKIQRDDLADWAKKQSLFKSLDAEQISYVQKIIGQFPNSFDPQKTTPDADPFVVALALSKGWKVITSESPGGTSPRKKIPDLCVHYKIPCLSVLEFFREKQWTF